MELSLKQKQFNNAMDRYNSKRYYRQFGTFVSIANIFLQVYLLISVWPYSIGIAMQLVAILSAFLLTDFVNGLVHMYMDNNDDYESIAGPLIANFHMHHKIPLYRKNNLLMVYFRETGSKVWLVGYLLVVLLLLEFSLAGVTWLYMLVYIGILSSVAEVSHYLCHTSTSPVSIFLGNIRLLLSKRHHASHHLGDNNGYAFLNGITDPLLDPIAARLSKGYKQHTDLHFAHYEVQDAESR